MKARNPAICCACAVGVRRLHPTASRGNKIGCNRQTENSTPRFWHFLSSLGLRGWLVDLLKNHERTSQLERGELTQSQGEVRVPLRRAFLFFFSPLFLALTVGCGGVKGSSTSSSPTPTPTTQAVSIKNVVVVIMQNRSFDHLFGTFPGANGIRAGVPGFTQKTST